MHTSPPPPHARPAACPPACPAPPATHPPAENIYRWRDTALARASDDFYPTDAASHIPHIAACAFNGLFISPLALPGGWGVCVCVGGGGGDA